jgi:DNA-directed RNA polymerase specialized sigma24 family protein
MSLTETTTMESEGSVTGWIGELKPGDEAAAQRLWDAYFQRLVGLVRTHLRNAPRGAAEEADRTLNTWNSVLRGTKDAEPTPELAARFSEEFPRLLGLLPYENSRSVAQLKMEGYTNEEIAAKLGCVLSTVDRKSRVIRQRWEQELSG